MVLHDKVALFDFCETLVNFQTADAYVDYVRDKSSDKRMLRMEKMWNLLSKYKIISFIEKVTRYRMSFNKRFKLYQLKNFDKKTLEKFAEGYYNDCIKPNFIITVLNVMKDLQKQGYAIGVVSGGYGIYEYLFVREYKLDFLLSSNIKFDNNYKCTGTLEGKDCLNENKLYYLNKYFVKKPVYSVAYSDSLTDIPFLRWATKGVVISRENRQKWNINYKFEEIIWTKR